MSIDRSPRRVPFLSADEVADRVADRSLGLLSLEGVAVDRLLMSLHPESARIERETLVYLETLDRGRSETHLERFERLFGYVPGAPRSRP